MIRPISVVAPALQSRAVASQRWSNLSFVHWRVGASVLAPFMPAGVRPDEHDGSSWVGLIAFYLDRATLLGGPPVPYFGAFTEVNVRLYGVDEQGRRGVVFLSLEASRLAAVVAARAAFSIPYFWSRTRMGERGGQFRYAADRVIGAGHTRMAVTPGEEAVVGDATADFLTARWGLFTTRFGRTIFLPNHHAPWALRTATLDRVDDSLLAAAGLPGIAERRPDSVLFSPGVTTWFGTPR